MPSGRFTLQIFGFEYFKGSGLFAITFCNIRILIGKKRKPTPAPENHHIYQGDGGALELLAAVGDALNGMEE